MLAAARMPDNCPALVLNADHRPLSYFPLSLWSWQDTIKAVFLERVNILAEYDRAVHSPSFEMKLPSVVSLKTYVQARAQSGLHAVQCVSARPFRMPVLRRARRSHLRSCRAAFARRTHDLGQCGHRLRALQSQKGRALAAAGRHAAARTGRIGPRSIELRNNGRRFPPNYLHESWVDYLYWDSELEP